MEIAVWLGRESRFHGSRRSLLEYFGQEALLEHRIRIVRVVGVRRGYLCRVCQVLVLGSLLQSLLQLALRHHLARLRVQLQLSKTLRH